MMGFDSTDHHHHLSQELVVDCGYTKVIASRVGALGTSFVRAAKPRDFTRGKREKTPPYANSYIPRLPLGKLREFTLKELGKATANFSSERVIGLGGFGTVFRGILSDGTVVAVKVLDKHSRQGLEQFQVEMNASCTVMSLSHPNLVPAIGYHTSRKRKMVKIMIVYPFMAKGDVGLYLGDHRPSSLTPLDWTTRKRITLGVARGICSLHQLGIIHRDIKPSNVLLDENFDAHVGDFGLAKSMGLPLNSYDIAGLPGDVDSNYYDLTQVCGTIGYLSPEMFSPGNCGRKSDVYAFGVTLIQIVTEEKAFDVAWEAEENQSPLLIERAERLFKNEEDLKRHMHPGMSGMYDENEAIELIRLGLVCAQHDPEKRPLMPEVIAMMEGSSATLKQRWDNYDYHWRTRQMWSYNQIETESDISWHSKTISSVGFGGSKGEDEEVEVRCSCEFDINEEELEKNGDNGNQLGQVEDFTLEESNKEYRAGNVGHQLHGYQSGVSCYNAMQPGDVSSGVSSVESTSLANSRSLENDTRAEIVEMDQNERGDSKQLRSQANQHKVSAKLREVLDQMREMELKHQAAMEEMHLKQIETELKHQAAMEELHQKQIAIMQSMLKIQEQCIQKVDEMQTQIDGLKEASQKL